MAIYSHSRLSTFEQCKLKYKFRYIDKIVPEIEKTIESHLGSMVHSTLEWLYNEVKKNRIPSIDQVISEYSRNWEDDWEDEIPIVRREMTAGDYFNKGIKFLIDYYTKHHPFNDNTISVEEEISISLDEEGKYKIRGFIDRLVYNTQTGEYEVHDYKTSSKLPDEEQIESDRQLALYSLAVKEKYKVEKGVILVWHYLSFNKRIESRRTEEQLSKLKDETIKLINEIESTLDFSPKKSNLCSWCEYKDICPAWGNKPPIKQTTLDEYQSREN